MASWMLCWVRATPPPQRPHCGHPVLRTAASTKNPSQSPVRAFSCLHVPVFRTVARGLFIHLLLWGISHHRLKLRHTCPLISVRPSLEWFWKEVTCPRRKILRGSKSWRVTWRICLLLLIRRSLHTKQRVDLQPQQLALKASTWNTYIFMNFTELLYDSSFSCLLTHECLSQKTHIQTFNL